MPVGFTDVGQVVVDLSSGYSPILFGFIIFIAIAYVLMASRAGIGFALLAFLVLLFGVYEVAVLDGSAEQEGMAVAIMTLIFIFAGIGWFLIFKNMVPRS